MNLGELITELDKLDPELIPDKGFYRPHSYRGYYNQLAFEPCTGVKIKDMIKTARSAINQVYEGYKGGDYLMGLITPVWISNYGETSKIGHWDGDGLTVEDLHKFLGLDLNSKKEEKSDQKFEKHLTNNNHTRRYSKGKVLGFYDLMEMINSKSNCDIYRGDDFIKVDSIKDYKISLFNEYKFFECIEEKVFLVEESFLDDILVDVQEVYSLCKDGDIPEDEKILKIIKMLRYIKE